MTQRRWCNGDAYSLMTFQHLRYKEASTQVNSVNIAQTTHSSTLLQFLRQFKRKLTRFKKQLRMYMPLTSVVCTSGDF